MYSLYFTIIQRLHFIGVHTSIDTFIFSSCPKCPIPNFILNKVMSKTETHLTELVSKKEGQGGEGWGSLFLNDSLHFKKNSIPKSLAWTYYGQNRNKDCFRQ